MLCPGLSKRFLSPAIWSQQNTFNIQGCLFHSCFVILVGRSKIWWKDAGRWSSRRQYRKCRRCYWFRSRFNTTRGDYLLKLQIVIEKKILSEVPNNSGKVHHLIIHNSLAVMHTTATFHFLHLTLLGESHMKSIEIHIRTKQIHPQKDTRHISGFILPLKGAKHPHSVVLIIFVFFVHSISLLKRFWL